MICQLCSCKRILLPKKDISTRARACTFLRKEFQQKKSAGSTTFIYHSGHVITSAYIALYKITGPDDDCNPSRGQRSGKKKLEGAHARRKKIHAPDPPPIKSYGQFFSSRLFIRPGNEEERERKRKRVEPKLRHARSKLLRRLPGWLFALAPRERIAAER